MERRARSQCRRVQAHFGERTTREMELWSRRAILDRIRNRSAVCRQIPGSPCVIRLSSRRSRHGAGFVGFSLRVPPERVAKTQDPSVGRRRRSAVKADLVARPPLQRLVGQFSESLLVGRAKVPQMLKAIQSATLVTEGCGESALDRLSRTRSSRNRFKYRMGVVL